MACTHQPIERTGFRVVTERVVLVQLPFRLWGPLVEKNRPRFGDSRDEVFLLDVKECDEGLVRAQIGTAEGALDCGEVREARRLTKSLLALKMRTDIPDPHARIDGEEAITWSLFARSQLPDFFAAHEVKEILRICQTQLIQRPTIDLASGRSPYYVPDVAVDGNESMLVRNQAALRLLGDLNQLGKGVELPFRDHFSTATMFSSEKYFDDPVLVYRKIFEALRPGGKIMLVETPRGFVTYCKHEHNPKKIVAQLQEAGFENVTLTNLFWFIAPNQRDPVLFLGHKN